MSMDLGRLSGLAEKLASQAAAARIVALYSKRDAEQRLQNVRTIHAEIGLMLADAEASDHGRLVPHISVHASHLEPRS